LFVQRRGAGGGHLHASYARYGRVGLYLGLSP
jgi:hypothetical protein